MSITKFQDRFLNGGCAKFLLVVMAVIFVGGLLFYGGGGSRGPDESEANGQIAVTVGNVEIPANAIATAIDSSAKRAQEQSPNQQMGPFQMASIAAGAVTSVVDGSLTMYLARQNGADFNDESVRHAIESLIDQQFELNRMQYEMSPNKQGTFEEFVKKQTGKTLQELKSEQMAEIEEARKDPHKKDLIMADASRGILLEKMKEKSAPTDEELKAMHSTYEFKRILFKEEAGKEPTVQPESVLADIKAGKLTFEQAIDRYSKDFPQPNKKLSQTSLPLPGATIYSMDEYRELRSLKAGETSGVITVPEGKAIYKLVKVTPNLPADFDKDKQKYRDEAANQRAQALVQEEIKKAKEGGLVKWKAPGYQALYELGNAFQDPALFEPTKRAEKMREIYELAKNAQKEGGPGSNEASVVAFVAFDSIYNAPGADKAKLTDERIEVIQSFLETNEDPALRLELVDLFLQKKDKEAAYDQILTVAQNNNDYEPSGQGVYAEVSAKLPKLKAAGGLTAAQEQEIQKELARWRQEKVDFEKQKAADEAEQKKQDAEMKAEMERQMKEEAAAKAKEEAAKPKAGATKP
ncbi:MAG TPA: peptidylprolyl isomerase [Fimbriimonas sp.]